MSSSTRLLSFRQTRISNERDILLRRPCVSIPQTEKMRSTNACDAGAARRSWASSAINPKCCCVHGSSWTPDINYGLAWENWQGEIRYYVMISVFVIILVLVSVSFFLHHFYFYIVSVFIIISQPSIYIDGWLYAMSMTSVVCNVPVLSQNDSTYHHSVFTTW